MIKKSIMILTFVFMFPKGEASQISPEYRKLQEDPTIANIIVVGKLTEDRTGTQFIVPERGWTLYPSQITVPFTVDIYQLNRGRIKQGEAGKRYLFYMINKSTKKDEYAGPEVLVLLPASRSKIDKLATKKDFVGEINPSWQFCESDNECVNSKNQCGKHIGVNKKYQKDYFDFLKSKSMKVDCSKEKSSDAEKISNSKCVENFCS